MSFHGLAALRTASLATLLAAALLYPAAPAEASSPAHVPDTMAQRLLACTVCHGREDRQGPDAYYPRIAGKQSEYLYNQLRNFRDGRRHYPLMTRLLDPLSDDYLLEIARYFSSLDAPKPPPRPPSVPAAVLARGRELAETGDPVQDLPACSGCHGPMLAGGPPGIPGLIGLPRDYVNAQFGAWKTGLRRATAPDCMADIARRMSPEDISAVSAWLAVQVPGGPPANARRIALPARCGSAPGAAIGQP